VVPLRKVVAPVIPAVVAPIVGRVAMVVGAVVIRVPVVGMAVVRPIVIGTAVVCMIVVCTMVIGAMIVSAAVISPVIVHVHLGTGLRPEISHAAAKVAHATEMIAAKSTAKMPATKSASEMAAAAARRGVRGKSECGQGDGCGERKRGAAYHEVPPGMTRVAGFAAGFRWLGYPGSYDERLSAAPRPAVSTNKGFSRRKQVSRPAQRLVRSCLSADWLCPP
jgi:hypothetical protein